MTNLKEFKELIEKYNSITIEEIIEIGKKYTKFDGTIIANKLTGFGSIFTCTLCLATLIGCHINCSTCTWFSTEATHCNEFGNDDTYEAIQDATTSDELLTAFKARAAYMQEQLNLLKLIK